MGFCYSKLNGRIIEICGTQKRFGELMGLSNATISAKFNNKSEFTQPEIMLALEILNLSQSDIPSYFFTPDVQKI